MLRRRIDVASMTPALPANRDQIDGVLFENTYEMNLLDFTVNAFGMDSR
jgi:hypothetical protein